jgi:hypothetical protein
MQGGYLVVLCKFWHENLWGCSTIEFFPSSGSHKHLVAFPSELDRSKVFSGDEKWHCFVHPFFNRYNLEIEWVIHANPPPLEIAISHVSRPYR